MEIHTFTARRHNQHAVCTNRRRWGCAFCRIFNRWKQPAVWQGIHRLCICRRNAPHGCQRLASYCNNSGFRMDFKKNKSKRQGKRTHFGNLCTRLYRRGRIFQICNPCRNNASCNARRQDYKEASRRAQLAWICGILDMPKSVCCVWFKRNVERSCSAFTDYAVSVFDKADWQRCNKRVWRTCCNRCCNAICKNNLIGTCGRKRNGLFPAGKLRIFRLCKPFGNFVQYCACSARKLIGNSVARRVFFYKDKHFLGCGDIHNPLAQLCHFKNNGVVCIVWHGNA